MAPFRNRDRSNRSGRGQVEHNVLEGLPINQYRELEVTIGPSTSESKQVDKDAWPEPPMPRDSHLLPLHSQQLLRAARSGRIYKPPAPPEEDRETLDEEDEHKEVPQGFALKKYVKVPRHLEEPEPEYLAKRRKGLPSQYHGQIATLPTPMRETKIKKLDSEGNVNIYKVLVPEGQTVADEVQEADVAVIEAPPAAATPGTVVEGIGVVNAEGVVVANDLLVQTPPRRRPPPPKKKARRGPGRGKKKVVFVEGSTEQGTPASGSDLLTVPGVKQEGGSVEPSDGDTSMADAGDEEEGDDDDGSDDDEHEEGEHSPAPAQVAAPSKTVAEPANDPAADSQNKPIVEPAAEPPKEPVKEPTPTPEAPIATEVPIPAEASIPKEAPVPTPVESNTPVEPSAPSVPAPSEAQDKSEKKDRSSRDPSSSPELPLSAIAHSRQNSANQIPTLPIEPATNEVVSTEVISTEFISTEVAAATKPVPSAAPLAEELHLSDGEDLLGSLERHLDKDESMAGA